MVEFGFYHFYESIANFEQNQVLNVRQQDFVEDDRELQSITIEQLKKTLAHNFESKWNSRDCFCGRDFHIQMVGMAQT